MNNKNIMITVFTPTFNRAHLLKRLYESIKLQKYLNFEWIIVDDGSIDNTKDVVNEFIKENNVDIKYIYQKNSGKHIAINNGVRNAKGKYFFIVDSDDYLVHDSLKVIDGLLKTIEYNNDFVGISGIKIYENGSPIGTTFISDYIDCTSLDRKKYNINGDKAEVFKTEILKKYPFPKIDNEKFVPEAYIWNKIASDGYKIRWFNKAFIACEYLSDGLTINSKKLIINNPRGQLLYLKDLIKFDKSLLRRIAHYSSYCGIASKIYSKKKIINELNINKLSYYCFYFLYLLRNR